LECKKYIAKSDYVQKIKEFQNTVDFFYVLKNSKMLDEYCRKNNLTREKVDEILENYAAVEKIVEYCNGTFIKNSLISEKDYLDHILEEVDSKIILDENQRKVIFQI
jgi:DNA helicase-4